jgi:uncharacterized Zn ribbon protein
MHILCTNCGGENAFHNGVCFECPDCDAEWGDNESLEEYDDEFDVDEYEKSED